MAPLPGPRTSCCLRSTVWEHAVQHHGVRVVGAGARRGSSRLSKTRHRRVRNLAKSGTPHQGPAQDDGTECNVVCPKALRCHSPKAPRRVMGFENKSEGNDFTELSHVVPRFDTGNRTVPRAHTHAPAHHRHPCQAAELEPQQLFPPRELNGRRNGVAQVSPRRLRAAAAGFERERFPPLRRANAGRCGGLRRLERRH